MTGRSFARLLAPLALVTTAVALYAVVTSGSEETTRDAERPAATAQAEDASNGQRPRRQRRNPKTYTVQPGDTPSAIAAENDLTVEELLQLNPDIDPQALTPGEKLKLER